MHKYSNPGSAAKKRLTVFTLSLLVSWVVWNGKLVIGLLLPSSIQFIDSGISRPMSFGLPLMSATILTVMYPIFYIGWTWASLSIRVVRRHGNLQALEQEIGEFLDRRNKASNR